MNIAAIGGLYLGGGMNARLVFNFASSALPPRNPRTIFSLAPPLLRFFNYPYDLLRRSAAF